MAEFLAAQKSFSVSITNTMEIVDGDGQKLDFEANGVVSVQRPNQLRAHRVGELEESDAYYDGKTVTVFAKHANFYAVAEVPNELDGALDFIRDFLEIDLPGADLLYSDMYDGMTWNLTASTYLGVATSKGRPAHHLAFRTPEVDFQLWVQAGEQPLPLRYLITSKWVTGAPQFGVELSNWNLNPQFAADAFVFTAPESAREIKFLSQSGAQ